MHNNFKSKANRGIRAYLLIYNDKGNDQGNFAKDCRPGPLCKSFLIGFLPQSQEKGLHSSESRSLDSTQLFKTASLTSLQLAENFLSKIVAWPKSLVPRAQGEHDDTGKHRLKLSKPSLV